MKKLINIFFVFLILFSSFSSFALADENNIKYGIVRAKDGIHIRNVAGTSTYDSIIGTGIADNQIVTILDTVNTTDGSTGCESGIWYKIKYLQVEEGFGYACSNFIEILDINVSDEFEATLLTFPESYRDGLRVLHTIYPNAVFVAYNTDLDFKDVVKNESGPSKSLLWDSNNSRDGLKALSSYDVKTNSFRNNYPGGGVNWYAPSDETIAYYIDPRNFFNESRIFMFADLSYNPVNHTVDGVEAILKSSFMANAYVDGKEEKKFSDVIMEAAITYDVSPYYIASRILQETGNTRSSLVLGTYPSFPEYNGYYNFYNIGASGTEIVKKGLATAKSHGWDSEEKSIIGGASLIAAEYINAGQDTDYFQKWNVSCKTGKNSCYWHQYQQNIEAPYSEAGITYRAYKNRLDSDMYKLSFVFTIPVFLNMPEKTVLPRSENPINYLSNITINGNLITDFDSLNTNYSITIPSYMKNLSINATPIVSKAKVNGIGDIVINEDKQVIPITVTALNGSTLTYNITVNLNDDYKLTLNDTITNIKNNIIEDKYIFGLDNVESFKESILKINSNASIEVFDLSGNVATGIFKTGYKIKITVLDETKELEVVVYGDTNGDGVINAVDYATIKNHIMGNLTLSGVYKEAADVNRDGSISAVDYSNIKNYIMGNDSVIKK